MDNGKSLNIVLSQRGLMKKDFADEIGITGATVSTLCKNKAWSGKMLVRVCAFFEMKEHDFIKLSDQH